MTERIPKTEQEPKPTPLVGIIMGSDSDLPVMKEAAIVLDELQVPYEMRIISAHRTEEVVAEYAKNARKRGIKVIIAGAGGAAHLPGMTAANNKIMPIIGVPIHTKTLNGIDSLYSIVQMPPGVPVGGQAINGAKNAGIHAAQILACYDEKLAERLEERANTMKQEVIAKDERLVQLGYEEYLIQMQD